MLVSFNIPNNLAAEMEATAVAMGYSHLKAMTVAFWQDLLKARRANIAAEAARRSALSGAETDLANSPII